jgi:hypothetical protein
MTTFSQVQALRLCFGTFVAVAVLILAGGQIPAALIAYEPFDQSTGSLGGTAGTGVWPTAGQTWSGGGGDNVVSGSLTYRNLLTSGNSASIDSSGSEFRLLGTTEGGPGSDFWLSFTFNSNSGGGFAGLSLFSGGSEQFFVGVVNGNYGFHDYTQGGNFSSSIGSDSTTHFLAVHFSMTGSGTSTETLYVDPTGLGAGLAPSGAGDTVVTNSSSPFTFDRIRLGQFDGAVMNYDEIRLGATWADVSPVPEPGALLQLACGILGCVLITRRRRGASSRRPA